MNGDVSFREWLPAYEREQEHHSQQIAGLIANQGKISEEVATISANVQTLLNNHSALTARVNRPWQWGVVVSCFAGLFTMSAVFATVLGLSLSPMKDEMRAIGSNLLREEERNQSIHQMFYGDIVSNKERASESEESRRWLEERSESQDDEIIRLWRKIGQMHQGE